MSLVVSFGIAGASAGIVGTGLAIGRLAFERRIARQAQAPLVTTQLVVSSTSTQPAIRIRNDSRAPITDVWVKIPGDVTNGHQISFIPPRSFTEVGVMPDGQGPSWYVMNVGCGGPGSRTEPRCDLWFVDARGTAWHRQGMDEPRRMKLPGPGALPARPERRERHRRAGQLAS